MLCDVPEIDGSAGGGQLLRWALTMSAVTERSFEMHGIRGARDTPGLRPQHVAAVEAIGALTEATTEGVEVGSERITFRPTRRPYGSVSVDIGTAGSIPLVFDTVLPLAAAIEDPVSVTATGGTDVKWSPPIDYTRHVKLPLLSDLGIDAGIEVERRGFYPKGQGRARLTVEPSEVTQVDITERGGIEKVSVHSVASTDLRDASVADRQAATAEDELRGRVKAPVETSVSYDETASTGSVIVIAARFRDAAAGFNALGDPGSCGFIQVLPRWTRSGGRPPRRSTASIPRHRGWVCFN
ncbi:MAG: RNA 3'-terminal phosphate cyclase [Halodesulfurarchaeum sp.]